ncbi:7-dehydrocholesterol reductase-like protein [Reticulomyxa filosa]|uniref:7-dehydrocholesterol reductase-like protein n=1 Tax=Reticulomyxa filosa TaxID=46433 RepID=X6P520_RETFI|nr:7-dehydrocholesterol reductase-like protein [Reticulomyxa filosa]|eukprot:ETO33286.1 7-dehydrocholesterol reductase-like protein [Reticulomyxa filosa]
MYDFWMGFSRIPRIGREFDLKLFCEARPGLQLWVFLNFTYTFDAWKKTQQLCFPMLLISILHWWYISDYFWFEDAILTTLDLIHDKFGFMLAFGDLVWVPWTYTLQVQCLHFYHIYHYASNPTQSAVSPTDYILYTVIFIIFVFGYYVFRQSNLQKHKFRTLDAQHVQKMHIWGKPVSYLQTKTGTKLLTSGWWSIARHMNYTGDWLMSLAASLCCCPQYWYACSAIVFFNPLYFGILLLHRERRDDQRCAQKYKEDWSIYTNQVPYRMIPYIY